MRTVAQSFTVVTGHEDPDGDAAVDWGALARVGGTIVILMGAARIAAIAERLLAGGLDADTPVAAVHWGTRPEQSVVRATLGGIGVMDLPAPSTIVVGAVAALDLAWFG
jgi:siroheme synthase